MQLPSLNECPASQLLLAAERSCGSFDRDCGMSSTPHASTSASTSPSAHLHIRAPRHARPPGPVYTAPLQVPRMSVESIPLEDLPSPTVRDAAGGGTTRDGSRPRSGRAVGTAWSVNSPLNSPTRSNGSASLLFPSHFGGKARRASVSGLPTPVGGPFSKPSSLRGTLSQGQPPEPGQGQAEVQGQGSASPASVLSPQTPLSRESLPEAVTVAPTAPATASSPPGGGGGGGGVGVGGGGGGGGFMPAPPTAPKTQPTVKRSIVCKDLELDGNEEELAQEQELVGWVVQRIERGSCARTGAGGFGAIQ